MATHGTKAKLGESGYLIARSTSLDLAEWIPFTLRFAPGSGDPSARSNSVALEIRYPDSAGLTFVP